MKGLSTKQLLHTYQLNMPVHYNSKWVSESRSVVPDSLQPHGQGFPQARILEWVALPFSRGSSRPRSPALRADTLPSEPLGKNHILVETPNFLIHLSTPHTHLIALLTLHLHLNNCVWLEKNQWPGRLELYIKQIHHHIRRRQWHLTPVLLPGKSHGRRSLVGCGPRGR